MQAKFALSALVLAAFAGSALAEGPIEQNTVFTSTKTRAEVLADLGAYKKAGVNVYATGYSPVRTFVGQKTRAEVVADFMANREMVRAFNGEDSGSAWLAQARGTRIPTSVLAGSPANAQ